MARLTKNEANILVDIMEDSTIAANWFEFVDNMVALNGWTCADLRALGEKLAKTAGRAPPWTEDDFEV